MASLRSWLKLACVFYENNILIQCCEQTKSPIAAGLLHFDIKFAGE